MSAGGIVDAALAAEALALAEPSLRALLGRPGVSGERVFHDGAFRRRARRMPWPSVMIKPVELLVISAVSFGAATMHSTPSTAVGLRPVGVAAVGSSSFAALMAAQRALATASQRQRTSSECGLQGARDRARAVSCT